MTLDPGVQDMTTCHWNVHRLLRMAPLSSTIIVSMRVSGQYTLGGSGTNYINWDIGECMGDEDSTTLDYNICGGPKDVNGHTVELESTMVITSEVDRAAQCTR